MTGLGAIVRLVGARARRRPGHLVLPALGIALAVGFASTVAAEGTIAGDQAARATLSGLTALQRAVRITWQGPVTPPAEEQARATLANLGLGAITDSVLLNPVRLSGTVVRLAAIAGFARLGPCTTAGCPVLLVGGSAPHKLTAAGVKIAVVGRAHLRSAAPLGFVPGGPGPQTPLLVTSDLRGLARLPGLQSIYRTRQWVTLLSASSLHAWNLRNEQRRMERAQAALLASSPQFTFDGPFATLVSARSAASAAPNRLLLLAGGALAALALFVALAVGGLREDLNAELARLRAAGARSHQLLALVAFESALLSAVAVLGGWLAALGVSALLASGASEPAGAILTHSLLTPVGGAAILAGWLAATALTTVLVVARDARLLDIAAAGSLAGLVTAVALGSGSSGAVAVLLAPLCCLAAGVVLFRVVSLLLPAAERIVRRAPVLARLSVVSLARAPARPALAVAFLAAAVGLGGFALSYRSTLVRGAADEAADRVPLDAIVAPGTNFTTPLQVAPLAQWRALSSGGAWPVRRTYASYVDGSATVTAPALGVPVTALPMIHGWRTGDGSAPLAVLARRLAPTGAVRTPGPLLPAGTRRLSTHITGSIAVSAAVDLRAPGGSVIRLPLGRQGALVPQSGGPFELQAIELDEPTGLQATNGHQNAENPAASTQATGTVTLGPIRTGGRAVALGSFTAVGAAGAARPDGQGVRVRFADTGQPGIIRPPQPSDTRPVPIVTDPTTAGAAGRSRTLALTVDGLPLLARVVGTARRLPTVDPSAAGFVLADEATLAGALDAQLPGQGRPDELWLRLSNPGGVAAEAGRSGLSASFRKAIEGHLRAQPASRAEIKTLVGAAIVCALLAVLGLLVALLGDGRDRAIERDLSEQGLGPRALRRELTLRGLLSGTAGVFAGFGLAVLLTRLAVAAVTAAGATATPQPPLVTVWPWGALALWSVATLLAVTLAVAAGARSAR